MKEFLLASPARHWLRGWGPAPRARERVQTRPCLESLESRRLLATITEYSVPLVGGKNPQPSEIAVGPNDTLYFTETAGSIGSVSTTSPNPVTVKTLPGLSVDDITLGPDGNIWFTEPATNQVGFYQLTGTTPPTPTGITANSFPAGITSAGSYLWFTQSLTNQIGRLDPSTGVVTEFNAPTAIHALDSRIVLGADGNLWFTELGAIGIFNPNTGTIVNSGVALPGGTSETPIGITAGPNGTIWYTAAIQGATTSYVVGEISTASQSVIHETPVPSASEPFGITAGADGNIWFTVTGNLTVAGTIDAINPSTYAITTLTIPTSVVPIPDPVGIVAGPDGNLWFTDASGAIGVVDLLNPVVADLGFQTPYVGTGFEYGPAGSAWTFTGSAGLAGNGSAFTSGNPSAPVGTQVGIIQQTGQISQTIDLPAGVYSLSFAAAQRASNSQTIEVLFDGTPIAFVSPSSTSYTTFTTNNFAATSGANSLTFLGLNPKGGDNTAFIDEVALNIFNAAQDGGFEIPNVGTGLNAYQPDPTGTPWAYTGLAGVAGNGSAFTYFNPSAPDGTQVGYIQQTGQISQTINLPAGIFAVTFDAAQRASNNQTIRVLFDGKQIDYLTPSGASYTAYTTNDFLATTGAHTLTFVGLNLAGGDNTAFIDDVVLSFPNSVQNGDFASPDVGTGQKFQYNPTGTPWTYTGLAGVAGNGSAFTDLNPSAPSGTQVGFIQQTGQISQSIALSAGTYTVSFAAAQRAPSNSQTIQVLVDSQVVAVFTPAGSSYSTLTTGPFTITAGTHTLAFVGLNPKGGDNTAFIDEVTVNHPALQFASYVQDPDFASPSVGVGTSAYEADPAGSQWTFTGSAGVAGNGSAFTSGNPPAPVGTQVAYIQQKGQISQTINLAAGTYDLTLSAAQRGNFQASSQTFQVVVDSTVVGIFNPSGAGYTILTTGPFTVAAGTHTLALVGLDPKGGDNTVFVDQVAVNVAIPPPQPTVQDADFESPGVGVGTNAYQADPAGSPWTFTGSAGLAGNGSAFTAGNPSAPSGTQVAYIQEFGQISQSFTLAAGTYKLSFSAAQRASNSQTIEVLLDGAVVGTFIPGGTTYATQTTSSFNVASTGTHTLTFVGLDPSHGDNTAFIDQVSFASA